MGSLETKANGFALAQIVGYGDEYGPIDFSKGYEAVTEYVASNESLYHSTEALDIPQVGTVTICAAWEHMTWNDVLSQADTEGEALYRQFKEVLELAKAGIVHAAIECELPHDYNDIDMLDMANSEEGTL